MCGIAGYVDFERGEPDREVLLAMAHALRHRGPDEQGVWAAGPCGLAHARLSIIDVAGSQQPLAPADSALAVAFNGEIYNYAELRRSQAARGVRHESHGDTEALLREVEADWEKAMPALDGMYAFAAWDRRGERLLLARDPYGKKPLFYAQPRPGLLIFASEIKAILQHPEVQVALDPDALAQVLRFRAVYGNGTLYRGIRQVAPGGWLELRRSGSRHGLHYRLLDHVAPSARLRADEDALVAEGRALLEAAVRKRLVADVPVGAFLSGGLDSSLIVALICAARGREEPTHTFSVGFEGDPSSELPWARQVAEMLGTRHTEVRVSAGDYATLLARATQLRDAPISEPADVAILVMSGVAKQTVKVVLSGEGSDEVFCGYPKYGFAAAPAALRALVRGAGPQRVAALARALGVDARRARVAARALGGASELDRLVQWFSYFEREELAALLPGLDWSEDAWRRSMAAQAAALDACAARDPLVRMQVVDFLTWLPCNLLERGDRMTMGAGLEGRFPFLDPALVAYGLGLPGRMKVRGRTLKWVVRRWAEGSIPAAILERPKWGFRVPLAQWFRGELRELVHDTLRDAAGLCGRYGAPRSVARLLDEHDGGRVDRSLELWTLLTAAIWFRSALVDREHPRSGWRWASAGS
jgi:asparagine synthase (glutamine-hydrolysing)